MSSRYSLTTPYEAVRAFFQFPTDAAFPPRYNIAPTQPVGIVRHDYSRMREFVLVRWGLIPPWVKDPRTFTTLVNARAETAADKPSFRGAFRHKRCLVPADGYYEWIGKPGAKRPHLVRQRGGGLLAYAGLWEHWMGADGSEIETMVILTVPSNRTTAVLHERMPAILPPDLHERWLDCRAGDGLGVLDMLRPAPDDLLEIVEVTPKVNNSRNEGPEVQEPVGVATLL